MFTGILGGLGEFSGLDPVVVRLLFVFITLVTGFFPFALMYLLAIFIIPDEDTYNGERVIDVE